jgi:hypothetical protein
MKCEFETSKNVFGSYRHRCNNCGIVITSRAKHFHRTCQVPLPLCWGDLVARLLMRMGFKAKRKCGCSNRKAKLNAWGSWFYRMLVRRPSDAL